MLSADRRVVGVKQGATVLECVNGVLPLFGFLLTQLSRRMAWFISA